MATCKDCLHIDACSGFHPSDLDKDVWQLCAQGKADEIPDIEKRCSSFKDRSRFVELPCKAGDTVYGQFDNYGKKIHKCKVSKIKVCQFKDGSLHYFLDVEFDIIDPYYEDGRLRRCGHQAVFGEDFGSWDRAYLAREEVERVLYPCEFCFCGTYRSCEGCSYGERKDNGKD